MRLKAALLGFCAFIVSLSVFVAKGCHGQFLNESQAADRARQQKLKIAVLGEKKIRSIDKDLLAGFLKAYNLESEIVYLQDFSTLTQLWTNKHFDVVISRSPLSQLGFRGNRSFEYDEIQLGLFCKDQNTKSILIALEYVDLIPEIKDLVNFKDIKIESSGLSELALIENARHRKNTCLISEAKNVHDLPFVKNKFKLRYTFENTYPVSWLFSKDSTSAHRLSEIWFKKLTKENQIARYWDQIEASQFKMSLQQYRQIKRDIKNKLPEWQSEFEKYGQEFNVPWQLIAAVAYQESKWNNEAVSYTGVKGIMQLTQKTALHVGVDDREDAVQSIRGGAYYLKYLFEKTPITLPVLNRWVFALASYNIGHSHMRDIIRLAETKNKNPFSLSDLKILLPMKTKVEFEKYFYFGLARGEETIDFIEAVLSYKEFLRSHTTTRKRLMASESNTQPVTQPVTQSAIQQSQTSRDF